MERGQIVGRTVPEEAHLFEHTEAAGGLQEPGMSLPGGAGQHQGWTKTAARAQHGKGLQSTLVVLVVPCMCWEE